LELPGYNAEKRHMSRRDLERIVDAAVAVKDEPISADEGGEAPASAHRVHVT